MVPGVGVMMEGTAVQGEPQPARKPRMRLHRVVLCCAGSVRGMVEEVGRNLAGLGFDTDVVCGAQARAALLGSPNNHTGRPTIYVLCVQGSLKETVLKPLRQALASHAGPHEHLFVGVLDLSLPLAMVGQIRRFADELERQAGSPASRAEQLTPVERREWREHVREQLHDRGFDRIQTRSYRALQVVRRDASKPRARNRAGFEPSELETPPSPTAPAIVGGRRPAKIAPTQKYRAVTGSLPVVPGNAAAQTRASQKAPSNSSPEASSSLIEAMMPTAAVPGPTSSPEHPPEDSRPAIRHAPSESGRVKRAEVFATGLDEEQKRGTGAVVGLLAVAGLVGAVWVSGGLPTIERQLFGPGSSTPADELPTAAVSAPVDAKAPQPSEPQPAPDDESPSDSEPIEHRADSAPDRAIPPPPPTSAAEGQGHAIDDRTSEPGDARADEARLREARGKYELRDSQDFWVTLELEPTTDWETANERCATYRFDGIGGWRLPWRRELKLLGAIERVNRGQFWSRSPGKDDDDFAYVYDADQRELVEWLKAEPTGSVVCIRDKQDS